MESDRFDDAVRALFSAPSRRAVIRALVGVPSGLLVALRFGSIDRTAGKKKKRDCPPCKKRKHGKCKGTQPDGTACANGGQCQGGVCLPTVQTTEPPPRVCPPVCSTCQTCNAASAQCEPHFSQQGRPAPGCEEPQLCCGGSCCEYIHACNDAGTCATCAQVCPEGCTTCVNLADGSTRCAFDVGSRCDLNESCATSADCPSFRPLCMTSFTDRTTNVTSQICDQPVGSGVCVAIGGCGA